MIMKTNRNYFLESEDELIKIVKNCKEKPNLLLHVCCAPCSIFPLEILSDFFNITVYYFNPNIFPKEEFEKRFNNVEKYISILKKQNKIINLVKGDYKHKEYMIDLLPFKDQKEGLDRCKLCYKKRLEEAFIYATNNKFDYVGTVMTSSRQKDSKVLNEIAEQLQLKYSNIKYFFSDFKKHSWSEKGYKKAIELGIYTQKYCGCEFSLKFKKD